VNRAFRITMDDRTDLNSSLIHTFLKIDLDDGSNQAWAQIDPWQYKEVKYHSVHPMLQRPEELYPEISPEDSKNCLLNINNPLCRDLNCTEWKAAGMVLSVFQQKFSEAKIKELLVTHKRNANPSTELSLIKTSIERREKWCHVNSLCRRAPLPLPISIAADTQVVTDDKKTHEKKLDGYGARKKSTHIGRGNRYSYYKLTPYPKRACNQPPQEQEPLRNIR
jgi:hypothetical protein